MSVSKIIGGFAAAAAIGVVVVAAGPTAGAASQTATDQTAKTSCSERQKQANLVVVQAWQDALLSGKSEEGIKNYWSSGGTVKVPSSLPYGGTYTVDHLGDYGAAISAAWDTSKLGATTLHADCDVVYADARWNVTAKSTGTAVDQPLTEKFSVSGGKITGDILYYFDTAELVKALG
ncbi:nuclear transport factor 2 family protein [Amycolatopsis sp. NPDC004378]